MKILLTSGEYSDYSVLGFFEIPSIEWAQERLAQWLRDHPKQLPDYHFHEDEFVEWLSTFHECFRLEYREVHLGSYSCIERSELYVDQLMRDRDP